jgi:cell division protein FtsA
MQSESPYLFVEISDLNYSFFAGKYDENHNFKILEKLIIPSSGIEKNRLIDLIKASETIKKNVEYIEGKINYVFKEFTLILDFFDYSCINISGYKKLNGSQILKENISYILNSLKLSIIENEKKKNIIHIFNSKSILDGNNLENLPIGLFGDFYNHELTFFLIGNNDLKNIKQIFSRINLNVKKILLKRFIEGSELINQDKKNETFFSIKIDKEKSHIIFFENGSFRYSEDFYFGTNIIYRDIVKVCSINQETIENFLINNPLESKNLKEDEYIEEKHFANINYRKIKKKLVVEIAKARIDEINNIILHKNINIKSFNKDNCKIYVLIIDQLIKDNFAEDYRFGFSSDGDLESKLINDFEISSLIENAANLSFYGWKKEAIPIIQTKKSLITRVFKSLFG